MHSGTRKVVVHLHSLSFAVLLLGFGSICHALPTNITETTQPLPSANTTSTSHSNDSNDCSFPGNPSLYGLGIRIGMYLVSVSSLLGTIYGQKTAPAFGKILFLFQLAMLVALVRETIASSGSNGFYAVEALVMTLLCLLALPLGDVLPPPSSTNTTTTTPPRTSDPAIALALALGEKTPSSSSPASPASLLPSPAPASASSPISASQLASPNWLEKHTTPNLTSLLRQLLFLAAAGYQVFFWFLGLSLSLNNTNTNSRLKPLPCGRSTETFFLARAEVDGPFRVFGKIWSVFIMIAWAALMVMKLLNCPLQSQKGGRVPIYVKVGAVGFFIAMMVCAVELTLWWNHAVAINHVVGTGQLIPLIVGLGMFVGMVLNWEDSFLSP